jgi:hypothetical protein
VAKPTAFFAYPSQPGRVGEMIEAAAKAVNRSRQARIRTWRHLSVPGKVLIRQIVDAIGRADIFACDLTYLNPNVLFELGFAIGRRKRIWIGLDPTITQAREGFNRLQATLCPVPGYAAYQNRNDDLLGPGFRPKADKPPHLSLLYVKQPHNSDASILLSEALASSPFAQGLLTDDPIESPTGTLAWYAEKIRDSDAVLVHLLSEDHKDNQFHNLKCAFVAGLARGFDRHVLMLAESPYSSPVDYMDLLRVHHGAEECRRVAVEWLKTIEERMPRRRTQRLAETRPGAASLELRNLRVGEHVAEHERAHLDEYFIETSWFRDALASQHTIFVGRRGTGKTATMYGLERTFGSRRANHVCVIQPVGYEVDGVIRLLSQNIDRSEKGYLVESLWKYLIYSELVRSILTDYYSRPLHEQQEMKQEETLVNYVDTMLPVINEPFSIRLERAIRPLLDLASSSDPLTQRAKISEHLHASKINELRAMLGRTLSNRSTVAILIDRLDEPWKPHHDIEYLSYLLLGLLRVSVDIGGDFRRSDSRILPVNTSLTIFLRSDIFYYVQRYAQEQDKLPVQLITWGDPEALMHVVDERLRASLGWNFNAEVVWRELFATVGGVPARQFISSWSLWRPRDIIFFLREAIATAVNRGHEVVTEEDLFAARRRYSEFVFNSVLAEDDPAKKKLEEVLYSFAGVEPELSYSQIRSILAEAGTNETESEFYIDLLCDLNFLGVESGGVYRYARDEAERVKLREVARRVAARRTNGRAEEMYSVNRAFYDVLQISR